MENCINSVTVTLVSQSHFCVKIIEPRGISFICVDSYHMAASVMSSTTIHGPDYSRHYNRIHLHNPVHIDQVCMCPSSSDWPLPIPLSWCCLLAPGLPCLLLSTRDCDMGAQSSKEGQKQDLKLKSY